MTDLVHFGGAEERGAVSADFSLTYGAPRLQLINPTTGGIDVQLPSALGLPLGGPHFVIVNTNGAAVALGVKNAIPFLVAIVAAGRAGFMYLADNTSVAGVWRVRLVDQRT